jgi:hypothetical protein
VINAWSREFGEEQPNALGAKNSSHEKGREPEDGVRRSVHRRAFVIGGKLEQFWVVK